MGKGFQSDVPKPRPADGYGEPMHKPESKDNQWVYPMPAIEREYAVIDGVRHCRFVTEWVEVTEDSAPTTYQKY